MNDLRGRIYAINDGAMTLASYSYLGRSTVIRREHQQPQVRLDLWGGTSGTYAGLDGFGRVVDQGWVHYNTSTDLDRFQYAYDGVSGASPDSAPARFHGPGHGTLRLSWPAERSVACPTACGKQSGSETAAGMLDVTFA
jgi:hypothetical protein